MPKRDRMRAIIVSVAAYKGPECTITSFCPTSANINVAIADMPDENTKASSLSSHTPSRSSSIS